LFHADHRTRYWRKLQAYPRGAPPPRPPARALAAGPLLHPARGAGWIVRGRLASLLLPSQSEPPGPLGSVGAGADRLDRVAGREPHHEPPGPPARAAETGCGKRLQRATAFQSHSVLPCRQPAGPGSPQKPRRRALSQEPAAGPTAP
jgi:hypothetical protein